MWHHLRGGLITWTLEIAANIIIPGRAMGKLCQDRPWKKAEEKTHKEKMKSKRYIFYFYHHNISTQTETSLLMVGSKTRSVILFFFPNCLALTFDLKEQWNVYDDKSSCSNAAPWLHFLFSLFMMLFLLLAGKRFFCEIFWIHIHLLSFSDWQRRRKYFFFIWFVILMK